MTRRTMFAVCAVFGLTVGTVYEMARPISAPLNDGVYLEDLTWVEVRDLVAAGKTTVIVPTGGTEQNGPHLVLGKHNYIVAYTAGEVAKRLGNALVAPVVTYVPEGGVEPADGHMLFAGTISVPEDVFERVLEAAADSFRVHGFTLICLLGDSGGNQAAQARVAARLNRRWRDSGVRVVHVGDYYDPAANGQMAWLLGEGETEVTIGRHAGIRDTSELLAVHPMGVRSDRLAPGGGHPFRNTGVDGDPTRATLERGRALLDLKIEAAVNQIQREGQDPSS